MKRIMDFEPSRFTQVPNGLRVSPQLNQAGTEFEVALSRLFHHYYCDSYEKIPLDPNLANFESLRFLACCDDFRFCGNGPGASTGKKRTISSELGQAFLRCFLFHDVEPSDQALGYRVPTEVLTTRLARDAIGGMGESLRPTSLAGTSWMVGIDPNIATIPSKG